MMASKEYLQKLRDDRLAREQARIQKLRELNLKKYGQSEVTKNNLQKSKSDATAPPKNLPNLINNLNPDKNYSLLKRPSTIANGVPKKLNIPNAVPKKTDSTHTKSTVNHCLKKPDLITKDIKKPNTTASLPVNKTGNKENLNNTNIQKHTAQPKSRPNENRKSLIPTTTTFPKPLGSRKSCVPKMGEIRRESVFDRLYKPKMIHTVENAHKHPDQINCLSKSVTNKRHTTFDARSKPPVRRSISAVHLKKINRSEIKNCIHKWASIGEKINKISLKNINEDENIQELVSAIKSERKKVKFQTPSINPEEMRGKLQKWLEKHGKSIDSYQHLQCFGVQRSFDIPKFDYDEENKENIALKDDSDNESYTEMNGLDKWRSPSCVDSVDYNESYETTMMSGHSPTVNELLLGALKDLTDILRNGYSWEEGARWLRAIRDTYSEAQDTAAYWECRAALEEGRGDMPASMQCWEQALSKGTERSVAEANIDELLAKFMLLKINPASSKKVDPKLVDAKNVFKSTLLRFAVQEAKANQTLSPKAMVTPVRRSARLHHIETPLKLFNTIQQALDTEQAEFRPNRAIAPTP